MRNLAVPQLPALGKKHIMYLPKYFIPFKCETKVRLIHVYSTNNAPWFQPGNMGIPATVCPNGTGTVADF